MSYEIRLLEAIYRKQDELLAYARANLRGEQVMADDLDVMMVKLTNQTDLIVALTTFVEDLKAHQNDPAKLAEIVGKLDANNVALAAISGTAPTP